MSDFAAQIREIKFTGVTSVGQQVRALGLKRDQFGPAIGVALEKSPTCGLRLARGIFATMGAEQEEDEEPAALVAWASTGSSEQRRLLAKAAHLHGASLILVHEITALPRNAARPFVGDYLAAGGGMGAIAQWLRIAGGVMRRHKVKPSGTDGFVVDAAKWVADKAEDVVDATVEGIDTLVDAVVKAGKSLLDIVVETASWTIDQVADLVLALIQQAKTVAEILAAAVVQGASALKKFVSAVISAGGALAEVLAWAAGQALEAVADVIQALRDAGKSVGDMLVWAAEQVADVGGAILRGLKAIGQSVGQIVTAAFNAATGVLKATLATLLEIGETVVTLIKTLVTQPWKLLTVATQALLDLGHSFADLLEQAAIATTNGIRTMAKVLRTIGTAALDLAEWAVNKATQVMAEVIQGVLQAGEDLVDFVAAIATRGSAVIRKIVDALLELGNSFVGLIIRFADMAVDALGSFIKAGLDLGQTLASVVGKALQCTYKLAAKMIRGALAAGVKVAELLVDFAGKTYWSLRKMVNGILKALGPIGEVLDWAISQAEGVVAGILRKTIAAIRYAGGRVTEALDWALAKGEAALAATLHAWEAIGEALTKVYQWARKQAAEVWETIGRITMTLKNSVSFVLLYLERDFVPGIAKYVKGAMAAGAALADFAVTLATRPLAIAVEVTKALFEFGATLGELLIEMVEHPDKGLENFLLAAKSLGKTVRDVFKAMTVDAAADLVKAVSLTLHKLKEPIVDMLEAAAEVHAGLVATVISVLLNTLASYRPLTAQEKMEAKLIFANSLDLDKIYVSAESLTNTVIFGLQDWARKREDSRAFTTDTLINFDVDDGIERHTMIHELTHVWQALVTGPFYMAEAIHAQHTKDKYNYGYDAASTPTVSIPVDYAGTMKTLPAGEGSGAGAGPALKAANGNFDAFNREQQAQLVMHYFTRRYLQKLPPSEYEDWQPYIDVLQAA